MTPEFWMLVFLLVGFVVGIVLGWLLAIAMIYSQEPEDGGGQEGAGR